MYVVYWEDKRKVSIHKDKEIKEPLMEGQVTGGQCIIPFRKTYYSRKLIALVCNYKIHTRMNIHCWCIRCNVFCRYKVNDVSSICAFTPLVKHQSRRQLTKLRKVTRKQLVRNQLLKILKFCCW